jgi:hypothetical protein
MFREPRPVRIGIPHENPLTYEAGSVNEPASGSGAVAQLGERVVRNDEVSGSIPLSSTNNRIFLGNF